MNETVAAPAEDEIDLVELALTLWHKKALIAFVTSICVAISVAYALTAEKVYTSASIFELSSGSNGPSVPAEYAGLASLAGVNLAGSQSTGIFDRIVGRDFIMRLTDQAGLQDDPFFNPPENDGFQIDIAALKTLFGFGEATAPTQASILQRIVETYRENVSVTETKNGSIKVQVSHVDPLRSAEISTTIMQQVLDELEAEKVAENRAQLKYLSDELAAALTQVELTKKAVADFALANSLASPEAFKNRSLAMFELRENLRRAEEMSDAVQLLTAIMTDVPTPGPSEYQTLRAEAPIVDDVDFRRLIGLPEALEQWRWPPISRLDDFRSILRERVARITRSVSELQSEAERYASSAETLAALERDAQVAEASYGVLIEQVKAKSLVAGYAGKVAKVYQKATPPLIPSAPRKVRIVLFGGLLGLVLGLCAAILVRSRQDLLHSASGIAAQTGANIDVPARGLSRLSSSNWQRLQKRLSGFKLGRLADILLAFNSSSRRTCLVTSSAPRVAAFPTACLMAQRMAQSGKKTALLALDGALPAGLDGGQTQETYTSLKLYNLDGVTLFGPADGVTAEVLALSEDLQDLLTGENKGFDCIFVSAGQDMATTASRALNNAAVYTVHLGKPGYSLKSTINSLRRAAGIDANVSM